MDRGTRIAKKIKNFLLEKTFVRFCNFGTFFLCELNGKVIDEIEGKIEISFDCLLCEEEWSKRVEKWRKRKKGVSRDSLISGLAIHKM